MAWTNDNANLTTLTNDSPEASLLNWDDMDIPWDEAEGSWDNPRSPWKKDAANLTTITNDAANS